jgi:hypothetical protein
MNMNTRPDHKSIAAVIRCDAIEELLHALACHDYREFPDAEAYDLPPRACLLCFRPSTDSLHLGRRETIDRRLSDILGPGVIKIAFPAGIETLAVNRWEHIATYASEHPADPAPVAVPADAYAREAAE